jgi:hypothetical protein
MTHRHEITVREPLWVLSRLTLDKESLSSDEPGVLLTSIGEMKIDGIVHGTAQDGVSYECTCGQSFGTRDAARDHLLEIETDDTGESVTGPSAVDSVQQAETLTLEGVEFGELSEGTRRTVEKRVEQVINTGQSDEGPATGFSWGSDQGSAGEAADGGAE